MPYYNVKLEHLFNAVIQEESWKVMSKRASAISWQGNVDGADQGSS